MATELVGQYRNKAPLLSSTRTVQGSDVRLKGGITTNFPVTGGKVMPAGATVVLESGDGLYYLASGADGVDAGDICTAAVVTSKEKPDADWKSKTITWTVTYLGDGKIFTGDVALGTADDSIGEVVTALNANAAFRAHILASDAGGSDLLVLTTVMKGRVHLAVECDLDSAFTTDAGDTSTDENEGTEADYRVITEQRSLVDVNGAARNSDPVPALLAGHFNESELTGLSDEAKAVLGGRGSIFG